MFVKSLQTEDNVTRIETHFRANGIATDKVAAIHGWQSEIPHEIKQKNKVWNIEIFALDMHNIRFRKSTGGQRSSDI